MSVLQSTAELSFIVGVWTGAILMAIIYILLGLLFHRPDLPDITYE